MTLLLNCHGVAKAWGSKQLFSNVSFGINKGDKIGFIGPNGAGKSTLLKILSGLDTPDSGDLSIRSGVTIGYVPQTSEYPCVAIQDVLLNSLCKDHEKSPLHEKETKVAILLSKVGFKDPLQHANALSGGWKKRLDIALSLILSPDILLLDEPTNHLDIEGIDWLTNFLTSQATTFVVTSHDRYFLESVTNKTIELNSIYPEGLFSAECSYNDFIDRRFEFLSLQQKKEQALASKARIEIEWLRRSPKARTTKSEARCQAADRLLKELSAVKKRNQVSTAEIDFEASDRQTTKLLALKNGSKALGGKLLFSHADLNITKGMRLGIVGPNGSGKTTLLKILAGEIPLDQGTIKYANDLKIVYFDQHRQKLDLDAPLRRALSPNSDTVAYRGSQIHINSWAKKFLFGPDRLDLPVRQLSGGEKARIGIAKLMLQPADLLLLDEPTNDLDIPTLETLEESLSCFPGAIALITHDRALLDNVANCVIGLGQNEKAMLFADYSQWEGFLKENKPSKEDRMQAAKLAKESSLKETQDNKLSYKEKKELEGMESAILEKEALIAKLEALVNASSPQTDMATFQNNCQDLSLAQEDLEALYKRWDLLEKKDKNVR